MSDRDRSQNFVPRSQDCAQRGGLIQRDHHVSLCDVLDQAGRVIEIRGGRPSCAEVRHGDVGKFCTRRLSSRLCDHPRHLIRGFCLGQSLHQVAELDRRCRSPPRCAELPPPLQLNRADVGQREQEVTIRLGEVTPRGKIDPQDAKQLTARSQRQRRESPFVPRNEFADARESIDRIGQRHQPNRLFGRRRMGQGQGQIPHDKRAARRPVVWRITLAGQDHHTARPHAADQAATRAGCRHGLRDQQLRSVGTQRSSRERTEHQAQPGLYAQLVARLPAGHR